MYWHLKLNFEIPIDVLQAYSLVLEDDVVCHKSNEKQLYQTQNSKTHALLVRLKCVVTLRSDL